MDGLLQFVMSLAFSDVFERDKQTTDQYIDQYCEYANENYLLVRFLIISMSS